MENLINSISCLTIGQIAGNATFIVAALSAVLEVTPVKYNPWSDLIQWIGRKMNGKLIERIEEQDKKIDYLTKIVDENEVDRLRYEILRFSNTLRNGQKHTEDEFDHIIEITEKYHLIIARQNFTNGKIDLEYAYILEKYSECQHNNSFL